MRMSGAEKNVGLRNPGLLLDLLPVGPNDPIDLVNLFDDEPSLHTFMEGPLAAKVKSHPALSDLNAKQFDVT